VGRLQNKKSILTDESSLAKKLARLLSKDREQAADIDHLFSLKNICFCGYHPKNDRSAVITIALLDANF